jgi:hypothetical protein
LFCLFACVEVSLFNQEEGNAGPIDTEGKATEENENENEEEEEEVVGEEEAAQVNGPIDIKNAKIVMVETQSTLQASRGLSAEMRAQGQQCIEALAAMRAGEDDAAVEQAMRDAMDWAQVSQWSRHVSKLCMFTIFVFVKNVE